MYNDTFGVVAQQQIHLKDVRPLQAQSIGAIRGAAISSGQLSEEVPDSQEVAETSLQCIRESLLYSHIALTKHKQLAAAERRGLLLQP